MRTFFSNGSIHIKTSGKLKEADLIRNQREGKFIYYELNTSVLEDVMLWITNLKGASDDEGNDKKI